MNPLAFHPTLSHLSEAHGELARLFARIRFIVFGEVEDETVKGWAETVMQDERTSPLDERALFVSLARAYRHLNVAWNGRHASEERVRRCDPADFRRWSKFPGDDSFRDLWPAPSRCRGTPREPGRGHIMPNSLQAAFLQMAVRKLGILHYIISFSLGDKKVPRPKGLRPGIETEPFTEAEFVWRMHRIYSEMNFAWAYRKGGGDLSRQAIRRRRQFPGVFLLPQLHGTPSRDRISPMRMTQERLESFSARARCGRVVAFDTETTGGAPWDEICQIAAAEFVDGALARTLALYVRPTCRVNPWAEAVHGLSDAFLRENGIAPEEAMRRFFDFVGEGALLVAHNAAFDLRMLRQECCKFDLCFACADTEVCDTLALSRRLRPDLPNHRLATLVERLPVDGVNSHDALDDALACAGVFFKLLGA